LHGGRAKQASIPDSESAYSYKNKATKSPAEKSAGLF
jgi:hypothetical protein